MARKTATPIAPALDPPSTEEAAVLRAVTYASLFEFPLTPAEVRRSLVHCVLSETELMALYRCSRFLQGRVTYRQGVFVPAGSEAWIAMRATRESQSRALIAAHGRILHVLCAMPFVRLLAVSGSLAHLNASRDGDVDLFVITRGARVWSVTTAIVVIAKLMGCRKTVCANFVVSDTDMVIAPQDEFSANQILHLRTIAGAEAYRKFLEENPFVRDTYRNFDPREKRPWPFTPSPWAARIKRVLEFALTIPSKPIEWTCRIGYGWYLRRKLNGWASPDQVRMTKTQLKLHGNSHRESIRRKFESTCSRAGVWPDSN